MEVDASVYRSPKRKRGQGAALGPSLITSGLSSSFTPPNDQSDELGNYSPSTRVAGKFQKLDLQSPIDLPPSLMTYSPVQGPQPGKLSIAKKPTFCPADDFTPPSSAEFRFESPIIRESPINPDPPTTKSSRVKSPPPSSVISDQFWHASEITGWSPGDPDEDNYGINGVGYAKPANKAWAISQKRKQQIADYRSRETKEARQRRHERRLSGFNSRRNSPRGSPGPGIRSADGVDEGKKALAAERKGVRFVHFEDG